MNQIHVSSSIATRSLTRDAANQERDGDGRIGSVDSMMHKVQINQRDQIKTTQSFVSLRVTAGCLEHANLEPKGIKTN